MCHGAGLHDLNYFYVKMSRRQPPPQPMQSGVGFYVMPPDAESQRGIRLTDFVFLVLQLVNRLKSEKVQLREAAKLFASKVIINVVLKSF